MLIRGRAKFSCSHRPRKHEKHTWQPALINLDGGSEEQVTERHQMCKQHAFYRRCVSRKLSDNPIHLDIVWRVSFIFFSKVYSCHCHWLKTGVQVKLMVCFQYTLPFLRTFSTLVKLRNWAKGSLWCPQPVRFTCSLQSVSTESSISGFLQKVDRVMTEYQTEWLIVTSDSICEKQQQQRKTPEWKYPHFWEPFLGFYRLNIK